ncbi:9785_t:CDS:2 [Paraglomus brasilianum]|uniref:9785_t:CDS:1 n=1 Tax=Paraglomus brasilianum TaxID=144538 RepID=A0A9N9AA15_9GLOM|nr:9785_t:CDS:2 [Paraglomus brasilianum]
MSNYFINNAGANEKVITFEAWLVWQKLNNTDLDNRAAKQGYIGEVDAAMDQRKSLKNTLSQHRQKASNLNAIMEQSYQETAERAASAA